MKNRKQNRILWRKIKKMEKINYYELYTESRAAPLFRKSVCKTNKIRRDKPFSSTSYTLKVERFLQLINFVLKRSIYRRKEREFTFKSLAVKR